MFGVDRFGVHLAVRKWTNCFGEPFTIRSYAFDASNGARILVLTAAQDIEIDWVNALVLGSLTYSPPPVEGEDG